MSPFYFCLFLDRFLVPQTDAHLTGSLSTSAFMLAGSRASGFAGPRTDHSQLLFFPVKQHRSFKTHLRALVVRLIGDLKPCDNEYSMTLVKRFKKRRLHAPPQCIDADDMHHYSATVGN